MSRGRSKQNKDTETLLFELKTENRPWNVNKKRRTCRRGTQNRTDGKDTWSQDSVCGWEETDRDGSQREERSTSEELPSARWQDASETPNLVTHCPRVVYRQLRGTSSPFSTLKRGGVKGVNLFPVFFLGGGPHVEMTNEIVL